jgi:hypothetical protein
MNKDEKDEPVLYPSYPPVLPPGRKAQCTCFNPRGRKHHGLPVLHAEVQDTTTVAWSLLLDNIDAARRTQSATLAPLRGLNGDERAQILTLPSTIGTLQHVKSLHLYGSHLVRLPPEIGEMAALEFLDVYTSYTLHYFPYELTRCPSLRMSRVSTRALYGNYKYRPPFPHLELPENRFALAMSAADSCSVCTTSLDGLRPVHRWITLRVGTDFVPLLVAACSVDCVKRLPKPPENYVQAAHTGGHHVRQPPSE